MDKKSLSTAFRGVGSKRSSIGLENLSLLEDYYERWKKDPTSVSEDWNAFFEGFEFGYSESLKNGQMEFAKKSVVPVDLKKQRAVYELINAYRTLGHYIANLDPLGFNRYEFDELKLERFGLDQKDLDKEFDSGDLAGGGQKKLREILTILKESYCSTLAVEFMHMDSFIQRQWIAKRIEGGAFKKRFSKEHKKQILYDLLKAELFEAFLHTRYVGQKRFSLEGSCTFIPMMDAVIESCPNYGIERIVIGMAHRGRLNFVTNILQQDYKVIFDEFSENYVPEGVLGDGDVRYHLGFEAALKTRSGSIVTVGLAPNPSHLEAVNPVVEGKARAWERRLLDTEKRKKVLPVLVHGDASFMGQGVVQETLNLSRLEGYKTGGTLHIIINNQIGFTTVPQDGRSTHHCTAVALMLAVPIFHVNGDDPLAAVFAVLMALEYRQVFGQDVVVDLIGYRRYGHNEGDEPSFTQPLLYKAIAQHPNISDVFLDQLIKTGEMTREEANAYRKIFVAELNQKMEESKAWIKTEQPPTLRQRMSCPRIFDPVKTAVSLEELLYVGRSLVKEPPEFNLNPKVRRILAERKEMIEGKRPILLPFAETLAFGTLLYEGIPVRLSGQDSRRGTFSQRHAVLYDTKVAKKYIPLEHIHPNQAIFCIYNSPLSEYAVLGFDYGYSLDYPEALIIWEAQYGDFANGAQVIIDLYLVSAESKWGVTSNIVLLLPHGYEGQGPEHSSARVERFLQACAEDNMVVAHCTTPANYFHVLRRQVLRGFSKPLVLFTHKSLLRHPQCSSEITDFVQGSFEEVLPDPQVNQPAPKAILCCGKVYYDLVEFRKSIGKPDIPIIRIEQLYPLHEKKLKEIVLRYQPRSLVWCQEEPKNMGAWSYILPRLQEIFSLPISYAGREASASTATGTMAYHRIEQQKLLSDAFEE
ncbi:2-oxoglutarate dehydrogenase E1 component [Methylacidiphilum caldifontis]|uniref:2-oxoglutarate dehydrogenase E1 component n=1 Tax=Methylacidiphilum caldifontis TaxID=2795386 RepID=UPI001A8EE3BE|nr:2-oxoglutarate dehydrogenase E1 component [Methylacidiphilum caldifontis]QSR88083.1 2-oxoglutarate dehydrogenase E1 component [Methylacidiphilum caldifontis]